MILSGCDINEAKRRKGWCFGTFSHVMRNMNVAGIEARGWSIDIRGIMLTVVNSLKLVSAGKSIGVGDTLKESSSFLIFQPKHSTTTTPWVGMGAEYNCTWIDTYDWQPRRQRHQWQHMPHPLSEKVLAAIKHSHGNIGFCLANTFVLSGCHTLNTISLIGCWHH